MSSRVRVACVQNNAVPSIDENIRVCSAMIRKAAAQGAELICMPEHFCSLRAEGMRVLPAAFGMENHPVITAFSSLAVELSVNMLLGSIGVQTEDGRILNRSVVLDKRGQIVSYYDKIHLFDVDLGEGKVFQESATIAPGNQAIVGRLGQMTLGLSICYDLRFPQLYRDLALAGANILTVPAAFTHRTGKAHWHILLRARAIENGCYVVAPGQCGRVQGGGRNFGHSLIVGPWGKILSEADDEEGYLVAEIDLDKTTKCRRRIPSLQHGRDYSLA